MQIDYGATCAASLSQPQRPAEHIRNPWWCGPRGL